MKWRSTKGELVLKITDDVTVRLNTKRSLKIILTSFLRNQCIKYKSKSSIILNRFDALTLSLMRKMQNVKAPEPAPIPAPQVAIASSAVPSSAEQVQSAAVAAAAASATQDGAAGGVKKKKPKKKK